MSDRLAISAALSVLMMSIYVLFGGDAARMPLSADGVSSQIGISAPEVSLGKQDFIRLQR